VITDLKSLTVSKDATLLQTIEAINVGAKQIALVVDDDSKLLGTVTDGDVRRGLLRGCTLDTCVVEVMNTAPHVASSEEDPQEVMAREFTKLIHQLPVIDADGKLIGLLTDQDMLVAAEISTPVVLMAGGKGVRLFPLTKDVPKPMLKIGDQPIIEIILRKLRAQGFRNIYISVNYLAEVIRDHVNDGAWLGLKVTYLEEPKPLGTAGALAQLAGKIGEPFVVMNSDLLTNCDLRQVVKFHKKQAAKATLGVREYSFQVPYGVVNIDGNEVESISEKPVHRSMVSAGIYVLDPSALDLIPTDEFCDMPTLLDSIKLQGQKVVAFPIHESWLDIGRHDDLNEARNNLDHWLDF
jgi:dTDP-glucose pyrophosphorylase/CBS domain-containing protein